MDPQIIPKSLDHDSVLKPMVTWGIPILGISIYQS